jgi:hypothetical protein
MPGDLFRKEAKVVAEHWGYFRLRQAVSGPWTAPVVPLIGLALATAGMIVLTRLPVYGRYASDLLPGLLPLGLGPGLTFVPITLAGTSEARGEDAGLASGLLNTAQQVGRVNSPGGLLVRIQGVT